MISHKDIERRHNVRLMIAEAREVALNIRQDQEAYDNVDVRELKAANLLLALTDEVERIWPEVTLRQQA